jgi:hypothetical protein
MKTLKSIVFVCALIIAAGCGNTADPISGVYVMSFKNEFSIATDTMVISAYNSSANTYQVERRDGYHRIREGKVLPKEFKKAKWMATFDKEKLVLQEGAFGRQIYLKEDGRSLEFGGTYQKIK